MAVMTISIPTSIKAYIETRVKEDGYRGAGAFLCHLIDEDQKRRAQSGLETLLLEGLASGTPLEATDEYIQQKRDALSNRIEKARERGG